MIELIPKIIYLINAALNIFIFLVLFHKPHYVVDAKKLLSISTLGMGFCWGIWGIFNLLAYDDYPPVYMFYISGGVPLIPLSLSIYKYISFKKTK